MPAAKIRKPSPTIGHALDTHQLVVQEFLALPEGYALVKRTQGNSPHPPPSQEELHLPTVPLNSILRMLSALAGAAAARQTASPPIPNEEALRVMPPETAAFLERFDEKARLKRIADMEAGRLLLPEVMRQRLGISRQALAQAVREHRMFALDGPSGKKIYPAFFADSRYERAQLEKVSRALGDVPGDVKWDFFTSKFLSLKSRFPLDVLAGGGGLDAVLKTAAMFTEL